MAHNFEAALERSWPTDAWTDLTVLVAVSGGPDSVALLRGLVGVRKAGAGRLVVAHFNHGWRGAAADVDQRFVEDLAAQHQLECVVGRPEAGLSAVHREAQARACRYRFLRAQAEALGARYLLTAHTADDQAETVLFRAVRGTGLAGLAGIPRTRCLGDCTLLRPLLHVTKGEILTYLAALNQAYCVDATNVELSHARNRLRQEVLPALARDINPDVSRALTRLARQAAEVQALLTELAETLLARCGLELHPQRLSLEIEPLAGAAPCVVRELLRLVWQRAGFPEQGLGMPHWDRLIRLAQATPSSSQGFPRDSNTSRGTFPGNVQVQVRGGRLTLERQACSSVRPQKHS